MSIHRVEAQPSLFPLPPRMPEFRRCHCICGCGRWWYSPRTPGRPPLYATPDCYARERRRRRAEVNRPTRTATCWICGAVIVQKRGRPRRTCEAPGCQAHQRKVYACREVAA